MFTPLSFLFSCSSLPSGSRSIVSSALLNILPSCLYAHIFLWTCVAAEIKDICYLQCSAFGIITSKLMLTEDELL